MQSINRRRFHQRVGRLSALVALHSLAACDASSEPLAVALHPWVGYDTLVLARHFKWLPERAQLLESKDAGETLKALRSGRADVGCLTLDEMLRARAEGLPLSAALVFDVSAGADVVLARPAIRSLADLRGARIGVERNAVGSLMFLKLIEAAGLTVADVVVVDLAPERQLEAWRARQVDAVVSYEPLASMLTKRGAHRLFDSRQTPETIFDVLAVRRDRPSLDKALLRQLVHAHFMAVAHMRTHREDAVMRIAAHQSIEPADVRLALAGIVIPSLAANRAYLSAMSSQLRLAAGALSALMVARGLLPREDDLASLFMPEMLPEDEV